MTLDVSPASGTTGIGNYRLTLAKLLSTLARKSNYKYDTAENGLLALQAFRNAQQPYDIVFMGKQSYS